MFKLSIKALIISGMLLPSAAWAEKPTKKAQPEVKQVAKDGVDKKSKFADLATRRERYKQIAKERRENPRSFRRTHKRGLKRGTMRNYYVKTKQPQEIVGTLAAISDGAVVITNKLSESYRQSLSRDHKVSLASIPTLNKRLIRVNPGKMRALRLDKLVGTKHTFVLKQDHRGFFFLDEIKAAPPAPK